MHQTCNLGGIDHYDGHPDCGQGTSWNHWVVVLEYGACPADPNEGDTYIAGDEETDGGTGNPNNNTNGGGHNNNEPTDPDNINSNGDKTPVIAILRPIQQEILACINNQLSANPIISVNDFAALQLNSTQWHAIKDFLITDNGCSDEAKEFIIPAMITFNNDGEVDFEDKLIIHETFKNNQKAKCVYEKLKNINGTVFSNLLSKFDNSTNAVLVFRVGDLSATDNKGITLPRLNANSTIPVFDILLDEQFVQNAPLIEIALALSHEMIHAELMARCVELGIITEMTFDAATYEVSNTFINNQVIVSNISDLLFSVVADKYINFSSLNNPNPNWQHEMFNTFNNRNKIAENIAEIHPWLDDVNNPFSQYLDTSLIPLSLDEYFEAVSWFGLESTTEFQNLSGIEITKKNEAQSLTQIHYNKNCN